MKTPVFQNNDSWYKFLDVLEADNPSNRLLWFNNNQLNSSDKSLKLILNPKMIVRYEPDWFKNPVIFNSEKSEMFSLNEQAFKILEEVSNHSPTFFELLIKFDALSEEILKNLINQLLKKEIVKIVSATTITKYTQNQLRPKVGNSPQNELFQIPYPSAPYIVTIYPTYFCNFSCLHCGVIQPEKNEIMRFTNWEKIIDTLINNSVVEIKIMGGEPLTHPDISKIINYLVDKPIRVKFCTNGYLFSDDLLEKILLSNNIDLLLSLDGGTKEIHDKMRNYHGAFKKMIHILSKAKTFKVSKKILLNSVISKINENDFKQIIDLAYKFEVKHLAFLYTYHAGKCRHNNCYLNFYNNQELPDKILDYSKKYLNEISVSVQGIGPNENNKTKKINSFFGHDIICNAGNIACMIDPLGNLYPCDILSTIIPKKRRKYIIGNVLKEDFSVLWNSEKFLLFRGGYESENLKY
ncbi:MAG: radical SAM protein, partial [bacterium]